jgi:hypothetical protein
MRKLKKYNLNGDSSNKQEQSKSIFSFLNGDSNTRSASSTIKLKKIKKKEQPVNTISSSVTAPHNGHYYYGNYSYNSSPPKSSEKPGFSDIYEEIYLS